MHVRQAVAITLNFWWLFVIYNSSLCSQVWHCFLDCTFPSVKKSMPPTARLQLLVWGNYVTVLTVPMSQHWYLYIDSYNLRKRVLGWGGQRAERAVFTVSHKIIDWVYAIINISNSSKSSCHFFYFLFNFIYPQSITII